MEINDKLRSSTDIQDLNEDNDIFGTIPKGNAIINIVSTHRDDLISKNLRMVALYGKWGSGKTSLLNYIRNGISAVDTKVIFF